jgi:hypothetical protein
MVYYIITIFHFTLRYNASGTHEPKAENYRSYQKIECKNLVPVKFQIGEAANDNPRNTELA